MKRIRFISHWGIVSVLLLPLLLTPLVHAAPEVQVNVDPPKPAAVPVAKPDISVTFSSGVAGNLYQTGQSVDLVAHINNNGAAQKASITTCISSGKGIIIAVKDKKVTLPEHDQIEVALLSEEESRLPNGPYSVEISVLGERGIGYGDTNFGIWSGPTEVANDNFGISYAGPLSAERTLKDLDLFHSAGIGWLRFTLQGWLPQGDANQPEAEVYNTFIQEASKRNFNLVAAFLPKTTVDPAVNPLQSQKEYSESLLAAATHYGFKVKFWDLQNVKPDPAFPALKGIGYPMLIAGRQALLEKDKTLQAIFTVDDPFKWNAAELYAQSVPGKGDILGFRFNFIGLPETRSNPAPPTFDLEEMRTSAKTALKRVPPTWVTEYGFEPKKGDRLPNATHQAALIARALLINRALGIERTFWRHDPAAQYDLALTNADGSAQPCLLALRTTLQMLNGATQITELSSPVDARTLLVSFGEKKKKKGKGPKPHYMLVTWGERQPIGLSFKTAANQVTVTDLWGNAIELHPANGVAMCQVDEYPRFIDLGENDKIEFFTPFARFEPPIMALHQLGENPDTKMTFRIWNNEDLFHSAKISCVLNFRRWPRDNSPIGEKDMNVKSESITLNPSDNYSLYTTLNVPAGARKGMIYEIDMDIMLGTRRIGYLTLPVWYIPQDAPPVLPLLPVQK